MKIINSHKRLIALYKYKMGIRDYRLLWLVLLKGVCVALLLESQIIY